MELTLSNIIISQHPLGLRRPFTANFQINGQPAGMAKLDHPDEQTVYRALSSKESEIIDEAERYFQTQPGRMMTLSSAIDLALLRQEMVTNVSQAPVQFFHPRMSDGGIVTYDPFNMIIEHIALHSPIPELLKTAEGEQALQRLLMLFIFPRMQAGFQIINTNLSPAAQKLVTGYQRVMITASLTTAGQKVSSQGKSDQSKGRKPG